MNAVVNRNICSRIIFNKQKNDEVTLLPPKERKGDLSKMIALLVTVAPSK